MTSYPELVLMRNDMRNQSELYRPTAFWDKASNEITEELEKYGVENFRSLPLPLGYFVPTYGSPANGFSPNQISALEKYFADEWKTEKKPALALHQFLEGRMQAVSDYRVLLAADEDSGISFLSKFNESLIGKPVEQWVFNERRYSRSSLNYLMGMAFLKHHAPEFRFETVLEVGGGFGSLGEIIASTGTQQAKYIDIDIPPTCFVAQYYLGETLGKTNVTTYADTRDLEMIDISKLKLASVLCSWQIEKLAGTIDLFVNFISFQEMEPLVVRNYLKQVERLSAKYVLLRNLREGKQKRINGISDGVETPLQSSDYKDMLPNYKLIASNVFPFGYQTVDGYNSELQLFKRV